MASSQGRLKDTMSVVASVSMIVASIVLVIAATRTMGLFSRTNEGPPVPKELVPLAGSHVRGDGTATVAVVVFSDMQCPYCRAHLQQVMPTLEHDYIKTGKILYVLRHLPLAIHPYAMAAAQASECAAKEGRFWELHDALLNEPVLSDRLIKEHAEAVGLERGRLEVCMSDDKAAVDDDVALASKLGLSSTPTFLFGLVEGDAVRVTSVVSGLLPPLVFARRIDELLAAAQKQRVSG